MMGTRPDIGAVVVPAHQIGGRGQPLQVLRLQRGLAVRGRQLGVGVPPRLPREGTSTLVEGVSASHTGTLPPRTTPMATSSPGTTNQARQATARPPHPPSPAPTRHRLTIQPRCHTGAIRSRSPDRSALAWPRPTVRTQGTQASHATSQTEAGNQTTRPPLSVTPGRAPASGFRLRTGARSTD